MRRLAEGEDDWENFARLYGGFICSECQKRGILNPDDREDVYQLVFLKLFSRERQAIRRHLAEYGHNSFLAVLGPVVGSAAVDFQRRRRKHLKRYTDILAFRTRESQTEAQTFESELERWSHADGSPEKLYLKQVRLHCLFDSLARGVRNQQAYEIMHLRYVAGMDVKEIAWRTGLSCDAANQRLSYYRRRLREHHAQELKDLFDEP